MKNLSILYNFFLLSSQLGKIHCANNIPKFCQGSSIPCESDSECDTTCTYPYDWTASQKPDHSKRLKVFIMMGQSNMMGYGQIEPADRQGTLLYEINRGKYSHLVQSMNSTGHVEWSSRSDVRIVHRNTVIDGNADLQVRWNGEKHSYIGPEIQFGHVVGHIYENPVLLIKVGTGGRALGWDFLPRGSERYSYGGKSYPGHHECPQISKGNSYEGNDQECGSCSSSDSEWRNCHLHWTSKDQCIACGRGMKSYAGYQYDMDLENVKDTLSNIEQYYPEYQGQGFDIEGFVFWQGFNDSLFDAYAMKYKENLQRYIETLFEDYQDYPGRKKFLLASVAFGGYDEAHADNSFQGYTENEKKIFEAQMSVDGEIEAKNEGKVKAIDVRSLWKSHSVSPIRGRRFHYNHNVNTYMDVGEELGWAMINFLNDQHEFQAMPFPTASPSTVPSISLSPTSATCEDDSDYIFEKSPGVYKSCSFLSTSDKVLTMKRRMQYCYSDDNCNSRSLLGMKCRQSCGFCEENYNACQAFANCRDESTFTFTIKNGKSKDCSWISKSKKPRVVKKRRKKYCSVSDIGQACQASCSTCNSV